MHWIDWAIVVVFCAISVGIGWWARRAAGKNLEAYFVSNRTLGWWLAGTSIVATAFSSDTPLLITGMVRRRGVWGVWEVWALGISTMLTVFVFAKLWKRANVMTEVELVELRYSGRAASFLRGFKAVYWGALYNCYVMGVWPVIGMTKVLQETTGLGREFAIVACVLIGALYTSLSGLWGVVLTDAFQFIWAMIGAVVLAVYAIHAVGGLDALPQQLPASTLAVVPPVSASGATFLESPLGWWLGLLAVQWWAWKNTDGGGVVVQRLVSCKDERQATLSVLWYNLAHYCLRSWPWVLTALCSLLLVSDAQLTTVFNGRSFVDHERAYPRLITLLLPVGVRGMLVASFFAAFLSTISSQLNWGASYLVNDGYKRFINRRASERHYVRIAKTLPFVLAAGAMGVAFVNQSIGASFTWILHVTAGIGPVYLLRWCWWRINPWSELTAMAASIPVMLLRPQLMAWLQLPAGLLPELLCMVLGTAAVWLPATLLTPAVERGTLKEFYRRTQPPGWWRPVAVVPPPVDPPKADISASGRTTGGGMATESWWPSMGHWLIATVALMATTIGPLQVWLGERRWGGFWCAVAAAGWLWVSRVIARPAGKSKSNIRTGSPTAAPSAAS